MLHLGQETQLDRNDDADRRLGRARLLPHGDLDRDTRMAKLFEGRLHLANRRGRVLRFDPKQTRWREA